MYRIGHGTDIHRLIPNGRLILGGILIDAPFGTEAHSDGDVVFHALIDALLGATAMGDIGEYFPPSDSRWKDANSAALLQETLAMLLEDFDSFEVDNVDITIALETPKLKPYKDMIKANVAEQLGLTPGQVSIKAKTNEGLDAVGRGDAVAANVTLLLHTV